MKKQFPAFFLALVMALALLPASALAAEVLPVGESRTLSYSVSGGSNYKWMVDDSSVIDWKASGSSCKITGKKPGSTTVWLFYDVKVPYPVLDVETGRYSTDYMTETWNTTWSILVTEPGSTEPEPVPTLTPSVTYGAVGDYVGDIVDGIGGFNAGAVPVRYKGLWGLANAEMRLILPFQYEDVNENNIYYGWYYELTENGHMVVRLNGRPYVINLEGEVIFSMPESFAGGLSVSYNMIRTIQYHKGYIYEYYYLDGGKRTDEQVKSLKKMAAEHEKELGDLICYYYWGEGPHMSYYGPPTGDPYKAEPTLELLNYGKNLGDRIQEGVLVVQDEDTKLYGLVDTNGDDLIPCVYDMLYNSRGGYLAYKKDGKCGLLENPLDPPAEKPEEPESNPAPADPDFVIEDGILKNYTGKGGAVTIPSGVTEISDNAFWGCKSLTGVTIPSNVTGIGMGAFYGCTGLTGITIPGSVDSIGNGAFDGCENLTAVAILNGVTSIGPQAFYGCRGLTSVAIPSSVTDIEQRAFYKCPSLKDVYYGGTEAEWEMVFIGRSNDPLASATIHYNSAMPAPVSTFTDVPDWCDKEVSWAVKNGVTLGAGGDTFATGRTCSHVEIVTFLWRAAGEPAAAGAAPDTITVASYFQDAVDWAYGAGVIDDSFQPDADCTRADTVTYLWKLAESPETAYNGEFPDVSADAAYAQAVAWAVANGVTQGVGGGFAPDKTCSRGEIVTFLYRVYGK